MPRYRWEWRGGTEHGRAPHGQHPLPKQIDIIDGRDGTQYAITDDVQKAERIVACLNYGDSLMRTT